MTTSMRTSLRRPRTMRTRLARADGARGSGVRGGQDPNPRVQAAGCCGGAWAGHALEGQGPGGCRHGLAEGQGAGAQRQAAG